MAAHFTGKYNHTLDSKGRIIVPAKFKKYLGDNFVLSIGFDGCLYIFPNDQWDLFVDDLDSLPGTDAKVRAVKRALMANSVEVEIDKQGRISIPQELRDKVSLTKDAVFVGVGRKIELWDKERYESVGNIDSLEELAESLTEYGISF